MKHIYLIRHGQTDFNKNNIVQGSGVDADLNTTGLGQAKSFFDKYAHVPFDKIYISRLKRTFQSVEKFIEKGIPFEATPALNEISWGVREGMAFTPDEHHYYLQTVSAWQTGQTNLAIEGGESPLVVAGRQMPFIETTLANPLEKTVLVCMHGRAMRIFLTLLLKYPLYMMDIFEHQNLCLYHLVNTGTMYQVIKYNDTSHYVQ